MVHYSELHNYVYLNDLISDYDGDDVEIIVEVDCELYRCSIDSHEDGCLILKAELDGDRL